MTTVTTKRASNYVYSHMSERVRGAAQRSQPEERFTPSKAEVGAGLITPTKALKVTSTGDSNGLLKTAMSTAAQATGISTVWPSEELDKPIRAISQSINQKPERKYRPMAGTTLAQNPALGLPSVYMRGASSTPPSERVDIIVEYADKHQMTLEEASANCPFLPDHTLSEQGWKKESARIEKETRKAISEYGKEHGIKVNWERRGG